MYAGAGAGVLHRSIFDVCALPRWYCLPNLVFVLAGAGTRVPDLTAYAMSVSVIKHLLICY